MTAETNNDRVRGRFSKRHGMYGSTEYRSWSAMIQRCTNPKHKTYYRYGGAGITVSEDWMSFDKFFADMGHKPSPKHQLDRIDNNNGYTVENCRWASWSEQQMNRTNSLHVVIGGKRLSLPECEAIYGVKQGTIWSRLQSGWTIERATSVPVKMQAWEAAIIVMRDTGNLSVRWGDEKLLHMIADKLGWPHESRKTSERVLRALAKTPGKLRFGHTRAGNNRLVRIFWLPESLATGPAGDANTKGG